MSGRKIFGVLSGAQVTILGALAIITPGAVYAVANTPVVITDPLTGKEGLVDSGRRLYVYDPIAGYANNPFNLVKIAGIPTVGQYNTIYTVPAGKALILKSANMTYYDGVAGSDNYVYFYGGPATGTSFVTGFDSINLAGAFSDDLGSGYYLHSGDVILVFASSPSYISLRGYLVPSNVVPAIGSAEAAEQSVKVGGSQRK
jgi:hypothetical protein